MADKTVIAERVRLKMEGEFDPTAGAGMALPVDARVANALEYIAYQLGQINRKMDKLNAGSGSSQSSLEDMKKLLDSM